jgi:iron complex transport system permease protein
MCAPTVVDGKVLVGNDYGAVYVLSEVPGTERKETSGINYESQGLAHWSWAALVIIAVAVAAVTAWMYRRA